MANSKLKKEAWILVILWQQINNDTITLINIFKTIEIWENKKKSKRYYYRHISVVRYIFTTFRKL